MLPKLVVVITLAAILVTANGGTERETQSAEVEWLKKNAITFATADAGHGFEDLEPLRDIVGDARIVGLGEGTHGTREYFKMKHRLTEFLATEMGFTIFSIEASTPEAYEVNDYVARGAGDPKKLIGGMYFWTWNTEEVLDMVRWMRGFNESDRGHIDFTGFDMQTPDVAMEIVQDFLRDVDPTLADEVRQTYQTIKLTQRAGSGFGVATFTFPIDEARGKRVRYRGFIKTKDLEEGYGGLWWRVDGMKGEERTMLAFDNMADRGPKGTSDWKEYAIELDVPADAVNINFGILMPGQGQAWFDGLTVELDGEPYDTQQFDLDFEGARVKGYSSRDNNYKASMDTDVFHSGAQSLKLESLVVSDSDAPKAKESARQAAEILSVLEASRDRFVQQRPAKDVEWVIHNARIVEQCMRQRASRSGFVRDESMAKNVAWILEQNPDAKIILWAHNGHVSRRKGGMGAHLSEMFGDDYLPVAFAARTGNYYAMGQGPRDGHELTSPPTGSIESFFAAVGKPRLMLDLRRADAKSPESKWLTEQRPFRSIGALAMEEQFHPSTVTKNFDVLIYFDETTGARQLDTPPGRHN